MKGIGVLGCSGMLGSVVSKVLSDKGFQVHGYARDLDKAALVEKHYNIKFDSLTKMDCANWDGGKPTGAFFRQASAYFDDQYNLEWVINCAGNIKPCSETNVPLTWAVNAVLPRVLGEVFGNRAIHIATDCIWDGLAGGSYDETSLPTCQDTYGLSKSAGDSANCKVIRTSIVGPELKGLGRSLLSWFFEETRLKQKIKGFTTHHWNGLTTKELAESIAKIVGQGSANYYWDRGVRHFYSEPINKFDMLKTVSDVLGLDAQIEPVSESYCNRTLSSIYRDGLMAQTGQLEFKTMVQDMVEECKLVL